LTRMEHASPNWHYWRYDTVYWNLVTSDLSSFNWESARKKKKENNILFQSSR
jgi:hypothetical protein